MTAVVLAACIAAQIKSFLAESLVAFVSLA
jgi:hypothetical protein